MNTNIKNESAKLDVYQQVTNRIIEQLEKGVIPWRMPWAINGGAKSYVSGREYSPLNQMLLGRTGEFLTFNQVKELGGSVKKGAKSNIVVFYKMWTPKVSDNEQRLIDAGLMPEKSPIPVLKSYRVFHVDDVTGIPEHASAVSSYTHDPIEEAETIITGYMDRSGVNVVRQNISDTAFYSPSRDTVVVPHITQYREVSEYYSTLFHELTHSTGIEKRCGRKLDTVIAPFGSGDYSREELVAEIGSAMLCTSAGINVHSTFENSCAYIHGWLGKLRGDKKMITTAAAQATKAVNYILGTNAKEM